VPKIEIFAAELWREATEAEKAAWEAEHPTEEPTE